MRIPLVVGAAALAMVALGGGAGCNIVGPVLFLAVGPEKVPAAFVLDPEKAVVILMDDPASRVPEQVLRRRATRAAEQALLEQKAVKKVIDGDAAAAVISRERFGQPLGIVEVGRAVDAQTVVYVLVERFTLEGQPGVYSPTAQVRVKVLDVESKSRLWPAGEPGTITLTVELPTQGQPPATTTAVAAAEGALADALGLAVARLFFEHPRDQAGQRLSTQAKETRS
jgi:hypothetical protein